LGFHFRIRNRVRGGIVPISSARLENAPIKNFYFKAGFFFSQLVNPLRTRYSDSDGITVKLAMDGMPAVNVPLRNGKKMKKRKELDALVANTVSKRTSGVSSHEQLLSDSSDEWTPSVGVVNGRCRRRGNSKRKLCSAVTRACSVLLIFTCAVGTTAVMWLFIDVRQQVASLRTELNQGT